MAGVGVSERDLAGAGIAEKAYYAHAFNLAELIESGMPEAWF